MEYSLGLVEVSALGNAIIMLDDMLKAADVEFVATERKLGGRLVTIVVRGDVYKRQTLDKPLNKKKSQNLFLLLNRK